MKFIFIRLLMSLLSLVIKPNRNTIVFGSWLGKRVSDSPYTLFNFIHQNRSNVQCYWITDNKNDDLDDVIPEDMIVHKGSWKSRYIHLTSKFAFINCNELSDVEGAWLNSRTIVVNCWHGTPIKKIGADIESLGHKFKANPSDNGADRALFFFKNIIPREYYFRLRQLIQPKKYILSPSEQVSSVYCSAFGITKNSILEVGYPKLVPLYGKVPTAHERKILYAPTYRGDYNSEVDILTQFNFDIGVIDDYLTRKDFFLYIRLHPANRLDLGEKQLIEQSSRIRFELVEDIYRNLNEYELLITDFSSVYFDFLALGKSALLAPFGLNTYLEKERELYYDISDISVCPDVKDWPQLISFLDSEVLKDKAVLDKLSEINFIFNKFNTAESIERLMLVLDEK